MDFNNQFPEWQNQGTEPSEELKTNGFQGGYKPPASVFNYQWNNLYKCIQELQEKLSGEEENRIDSDNTMSDDISELMESINAQKEAYYPNVELQSNSATTLDNFINEIDFGTFDTIEENFIARVNITDINGNVATGFLIGYYAEERGFQAWNQFITYSHGDTTALATYKRQQYINASTPAENILFGDWEQVAGIGDSYLKEETYSKSQIDQKVNDPNKITNITITSYQGGGYGSWDEMDWSPLDKKYTGIYKVHLEWMDSTGGYWPQIDGYVICSFGSDCGGQSGYYSRQILIGPTDNYQLERNGYWDYNAGETEITWGAWQTRS